MFVYVGGEAQSAAAEEARDKRNVEKIHVAAWRDAACHYSGLIYGINTSWILWKKKYKQWHLELQAPQSLMSVKSSEFPLRNGADKAS